jgi:hypothetical protein
MALNINGALIETSNSALKITANSITGLDINSSNFPVLSRRPYFVAQGNQGAWTNLNSANWTTIVFNTAVVNNGSHYNTSNGYFTAPVTGVYYFEAHLYHLKNTDTSATSYTHPIFRVNGSYTQRQAMGNVPYRLRSRTNVAGAYSTDTQINDIFRLTAGDYVEYHVYSSGATQWYPQLSLYSGFLIG